MTTEHKPLGTKELIGNWNRCQDKCDPATEVCNIETGECSPILKSGVPKVTRDLKEKYGPKNVTIATFTDALRAIGHDTDLYNLANILEIPTSSESSVPSSDLQYKLTEGKSPETEVIVDTFPTLERAIEGGCLRIIEILQNSNIEDYGQYNTYCSELEKNLFTSSPELNLYWSIIKPDEQLIITENLEEDEPKEEITFTRIEIDERLDPFLMPPNPNQPYMRISSKRWAKTLKKNEEIFPHPKTGKEYIGTKDEIHNLKGSMGLLDSVFEMEGEVMEPELDIYEEELSPLPEIELEYPEGESYGEEVAKISPEITIERITKDKWLLYFQDGEKEEQLLDTFKTKREAIEAAIDHIDRSLFFSEGDINLFHKEVEDALSENGIYQVEDMTWKIKKREIREEETHISTLEEQPEEIKIKGCGLSGAPKCSKRHPVCNLESGRCVKEMSENALEKKGFTEYISGDGRTYVGTPEAIELIQRRIREELEEKIEKRELEIPCSHPRADPCPIGKICDVDKDECVLEVPSVLLNKSVYEVGDKRFVGIPESIEKTKKIFSYVPKEEIEIPTLLAPTRPPPTDIQEDLTEKLAEKAGKNIDFEEIIKEHSVKPTVEKTVEEGKKEEKKVAPLPILGLTDAEREKIHEVFERCLIDL